MWILQERDSMSSESQPHLTTAREAFVGKRNRIWNFIYCLISERFETFLKIQLQFNWDFHSCFYWNLSQPSNRRYKVLLTPDQRGHLVFRAEGLRDIPAIFRIHFTLKYSVAFLSDWERNRWFHTWLVSSRRFLYLCWTETSLMYCVNTLSKHSSNWCVCHLRGSVENHRNHLMILQMYKNGYPKVVTTIPSLKTENCRTPFMSSPPQQMLLIMLNLLYNTEINTSTVT